MQSLILLGTVVGATLTGVALGSVATRLLLAFTARLVAVGRSGVRD